MQLHNPENERIKRAYFTYLKEARQLSESSVDVSAAALARFERYIKNQSFKRFHIQQAVGFKRALAVSVNKRTGEALSKHTQLKTLKALEKFFRWLAGQPGYRSCLSFSDAQYFSLPEKETRIESATHKNIPTIDQIAHVIRLMPMESELTLRDRALVAFTLLTGARDGAIISFKIKHIDLLNQKVRQDAREVKTKFSKTFTTWFFPVPAQIRHIVHQWVVFLVKEKLYGPNDPLFPSTRVALDYDRKFKAVGLSRSHWSSATPVRKIFKRAFVQAGLPYAHPHSFRNTLTQLGQRVCRTAEEFKAWSQNLGHEGVLTTLTSYGTLPEWRQGEVIQRLQQPPDEPIAHVPDPNRLLELVLQAAQTKRARD